MQRPGRSRPRPFRCGPASPVDLSLRYPDLTIACGPQSGEDRKVLDGPRVIMELLSPSTRGYDEGPKLAEYGAIPSVETIVVIDPLAGRTQILRRLGPEEWNDRRWMQPADVPLPGLGITIPHAEIFATD